MKATFMYLAAGAMLLTACSQTDMITEVDINGIPQEISFATFANKATKATASGNAGLEIHHKTFSVWGSKKAGGAYTKVYDGMTITHEASGDIWKPAEKRYWDKAASNYYFFAAAPSTLSWALTWKGEEPTASADYSNATIKLSNFSLKGVNIASASSDATASWLTKDDVDLMVADHISQTETSGTVTLSFKHILSRLNVIVKKGIDETVTLTKLKICKVKNAGSFDESKNNYKGGSTLRWGTPTASGDYEPTWATSLTLDKTGKYVIETVIIPQNVTFETVTVDGSGSKNQAYLYIEYKIGSEPYFGYYNLANSFGVASGDAAFNEGQQNTITITIGSDDNLIKFDATTSAWSDAAQSGSLSL